MRWKIARVKGRKIICLALSFIICIILFAGAVISVPVPVLALSAGGVKGTIASIIISLLLQTGVAPTNTTWLSQLNNAYGVTSSIGTIEDAIASGLLTETASGLADTGLSTAIAAAPEYTSLGLDAIFSTTASDAGVTVATGASNLATTAINVGTLGTIGAFAGAAAVGVGVGVLVNHVREKFLSFIRQGASITYSETAINNAPSGTRPFTNIYGSTSVDKYRVVYNYFPINSVVCAYPTSEPNYCYQLIGASKSPGSYSYVAYTGDSMTSGSVSITSTPSYVGYNGRVGNWGSPSTNVRVFDTREDCLGYVESCLANPDYNFTPYSPDLVGPDGNHVANTDPETGTVNTPGIRNIVPDGYDMIPVEFDEYLDYADDANINTNDGFTSVDTQGLEFQEFVDDYFVLSDNPDDPDEPIVDPDSPVIPDNNIDVPTYPDRPVAPDQPETLPDKPEITDEEIEESLNLAATPDLRGVFPFCIPWDIYNIVHIFDTGSNRSAPHIVFTFPGTNWSIDVDLSVFNPVAAILRVLELILFIVGLAVATRALIGAGG